jgi:Domain of unknown function (DUF4160)
MAPTIHREGPFRFFFFSNEPNEPPHVHVQAAGASAKIWLHAVSVAQNQGFAAQELNQILRIVRERSPFFQEAWNDHFASN